MEVNDIKYVVMDGYSPDATIIRVTLVDPLHAIRGWKVKTDQDKIMQVPVYGLYANKDLAKESIVKCLNSRIEEFQEALKRLENE